VATSTHVGGGRTDADVNVFGPIAQRRRPRSPRRRPQPPKRIRSAWRIELPSCEARSLDEFRIGVWFDAPECPLGAEYRAMLGATADALSDAGAKLDEGHPPVAFGHQTTLFFHLVGAAVSVSAPDEAAEVMAGSHRSWLRAAEQRAALQGVWAEWFEQYDLLVALSCTAARPRPGGQHHGAHRRGRRRALLPQQPDLPAC
jgi:amidase